MSFINKTTCNNSQIVADELSIDTINGVNSIYENISAASANSISAPWYPYTLDYSKNASFYIPVDYETSINFQCIITNVPVDDSKIYTLSLIYYQSINKVYCNQIKILNTNGDYILGNATTYVSPLFGNGSPTLLSSPCLVIQQFIIVPIKNSSLSTTSKYCISNICNAY